jgi:hypothetical protein
MNLGLFSPVGVDCVAIVIICPIRLIAMGNDDSEPAKENYADLP